MSPPIKRPPNKPLLDCFRQACITQTPVNMQTGAQRIIITTEERYGLNKFEVDLSVEAMLKYRDPMLEIYEAYHKALVSYYADPAHSLEPGRHDRGWPHAAR